MFAGFSHRPAIQLATKLVKTLPNNLDKVFFSDNGSTAVEVAIKIALQYWKNKGYIGKNKLVALDGGYHGDTVGAMSVSKGSGFLMLTMITCSLLILFLFLKRGLKIMREKKKKRHLFLF